MTRKQFRSIAVMLILSTAFALLAVTLHVEQLFRIVCYTVLIFCAVWIVLFVEVTYKGQTYNNLFNAVHYKLYRMKYARTAGRRKSSGAGRYKLDEQQCCGGCSTCQSRKQGGGTTRG